MPCSACSGTREDSGGPPVTVYVDDWRQRGGQQATATGVQEIDDCNPNCAQGSFAGYAATVTVAGLKPYGTGLEGYSTIEIEAPEADDTSTFTAGTVP